MMYASLLLLSVVLPLRGEYGSVPLAHTRTAVVAVLFEV